MICILYTPGTWNICLYMVVSVGWFQIFTWEKWLFKQNIHLKLVVQLFQVCIYIYIINNINNCDSTSPIWLCRFSAIFGSAGGVFPQEREREIHAIQATPSRRGERVQESSPSRRRGTKNINGTYGRMVSSAHHRVDGWFWIVCIFFWGNFWINLFRWCHQFSSFWSNDFQLTSSLFACESISSKMSWYCWWFGNPANQLIWQIPPLFTEFYTAGGCLRFLNHQQ